jgi:hypothetical protein
MRKCNVLQGGTKFAMFGLSMFEEGMLEVVFVLVAIGLSASLATLTVQKGPVNCVFQKGAIGIRTNVESASGGMLDKGVVELSNSVHLFAEK